MSSTIRSSPADPAVNYSKLVVLKVFGGPHHGHVISIPAVTDRIISLSAHPITEDGAQTHRETRTDKGATFRNGETRVLYERKISATGLNVGQEYLGYIEAKEVQQIAFAVIQHTRRWR